MNLKLVISMINDDSTINDNNIVRFSKDLLSALSSSSIGLLDLLEIGYKALGNPLIITDKSWKAIAITPNIEIPGDKGWNEFQTYGLLSPDTVASNIKDRLSHIIDTSTSYFRWQTSDMKYPRIFGKITAGNNTVAVISLLEYYKPFTDSDSEILEILCNAVAAELQKYQYQQFTRGMQHEDFFINLLEEKLKDSRLIIERQKLLDMKFQKYIYVLVYEIQDAETNQISSLYLRDTLEKMILEAKSLIYNNNVVLVASFSSIDYLDTVVIEDLKLLLVKFNIRCGISRRFEQIDSLRLHYDQAIMALNIGLHMEYDKLIYHYSEYAIYHVSKMCWDSGWAEALIHPALKTLIEYDIENRSDFVYTLYTFLRNFGNVTDMSKSMHTHRNTIIYRIKRIEEIMSISLSDYSTMEQIIFSLRLMEYNKTINRGQITS